MTRRPVDRLIIGGLGALTPVVAQLLLVDLERVFAQATIYAVLGYAIRVAVLFGVGVLAVYLDDSEFSRARLYQIGMSAPALLLATMNGAQLGRAEAALPPPAPNVAQTGGTDETGDEAERAARLALERAIEERLRVRKTRECAPGAACEAPANTALPDPAAPTVSATGSDGSVFGEVLRGAGVK